MSEHGGAGGKMWYDFVAGSMAGVSLVLVGYPMDTVKVRMQTMSGSQSVMNATFSAIRNEGVLGLYRGVLSPLTGVPFMYFMSFGSRGVSQRLLPWDQNSLKTAFVAGGMSGVFTTVVTTPVELVKARLQILRERGGGGPRDTARMFRAATSGGLRSLYTGFGMTMLRDVPGSSLYYGVYHVCKEMLGGENIGLGGTLLAGGMAGVVAWMCLFPVDLIKSRVQTHATMTGQAVPPKAMDVLRQVLREAGVRGLYRGMSASLIRAFPADAAAFFGYEYTMKFLRHNFD